MSDSDGDESVPPDVQHGDAVPADHNPAADAGGDGAAATPTHPVWAAAAGRGGAPKGGSGSLFAPISMMELELRGRGDFDGASSTASVRGKGKHNEKSRRKRTKPPRDYDDVEGGDDDDGEASAVGSEPDIANAAFGGKRKVGHACGSEVSDDALSVASADRRAAHSRAFPVSGVTCVGCALPAKVAPVNEFIQKNMANMSELALFKMAAMIYLNKVAEPAEEEGVSVPVRCRLAPWPPNATNKPPYATSLGTGRTFEPTLRSTRSTPSSSDSKISGRSEPCARRWSSSCCAATRRAANSRSTRPTQSKYSKLSQRPVASLHCSTTPLPCGRSNPERQGVRVCVCVCVWHG